MGRINPETGEAKTSAWAPSTGGSSASSRTRSACLLDELWDRRTCSLSYLEVALDLIVGHRQHASEVTRWMKRHFVQPYRRCKEEMGEAEASAYWSRRRWRVKAAAVYGDRPSKVTVTRRCHVDMCFKGAGKVQVAGVVRPRDLLPLLRTEFRDFCADT